MAAFIKSLKYIDKSLLAGLDLCLDKLVVPCFRKVRYRKPWHVVATLLVLSICVWMFIGRQRETPTSSNSHIARDTPGGAAIQQLTHQPITYHLNSKLFTKYVSRWDSAGCASGQIYNFKAVCSADGCLRKLTVDLSSSEMSNIHSQRGETINNFLSQHTRNRYIVNFHLLIPISHMQWNSGAYGSVGVMGPYDDQFLTTISMNVEDKVGEMFFVSSQVAQRHTSRDTYLRMWQDDTLLLTKTVFLHWDMPSFRMIIINGSQDVIHVMKDLTTAACIVRKGGVIIIDASEGKYTKTAVKLVKRFFELYGIDAFVPLLFYQNAWYICTASDFDFYKNQLQQTLAEQFHLKLKPAHDIGLKLQVLMQ